MKKTRVVFSVVFLMSQVVFARGTHSNSHHGRVTAQNKKSEKSIDVSVTKKGFEPARIETKAGEKLILNITRKVKVTCATEISIPSLKIKKDLPLNKTVTLELTSLAKGEVVFGCGMSQMIGGVILVK